MHDNLTIKHISNKKSENTPKRIKKSSECGLKQYLTFSGTKPEVNAIKGNYSTANNEKCNSYRINSESSITNVVNISHSPGTVSNKKAIIEAMKVLKYQKSSLDHKKCSFDLLTKSKSNLFCLLVSFDQISKEFVKEG
jgi:hypothetical protein